MQFCPTSDQTKLTKQASLLARYCFGTSWAEKSKTRRHLTEFWMVEPEVAYFTLEEDMQLAEDFVSYILGRVLDRRREELKVLERDTSKLEKAAAKPYPRITYDEAIDRLKAKGLTVNWGDDLGGDEETALSSDFETPVLVHRYPAACKAFYMKRDPARPRDRGMPSISATRKGYRQIIGGGRREDATRRWRRGVRSWVARSNRSTGTSTCAVMDRCRTPVSGWVLSGWSHGPAGFVVFARGSAVPAHDGAPRAVIPDRSRRILRRQPVSEFVNAGQKLAHMDATDMGAKLYAAAERPRGVCRDSRNVP